MRIRMDHALDILVDRTGMASSGMYSRHPGEIDFIVLAPDTQLVLPSLSNTHVVIVNNTLTRGVAHL